MADPARPPAVRAVFLSYTTGDLAIALAVCEALREAGIEVWMGSARRLGHSAAGDDAGVACRHRIA